MWELSSKVVSELEIWWLSSELDEMPMPAASTTVAEPDPDPDPDPSSSLLLWWLLWLWLWLLLSKEQFWRDLSKEAVIASIFGAVCQMLPTAINELWKPQAYIHVYNYLKFLIWWSIYMCVCAMIWYTFILGCAALLITCDCEQNQMKLLVVLNNSHTHQREKQLGKRPWLMEAINRIEMRRGGGR